MRTLAGIVVGIAGVAFLLVVATGWIYGEIGAENESRAWGSAYGAPLDHALADYARANPDAASVRTGFFTESLPRSPCSVPPQVFADDHRVGVTGCTAVAVNAGTVHPWVRWIVPPRVLIRVSAPLWSDPTARVAILQLIGSRTALCAAADAELSEPISREARQVLRCGAPRGPNQRVYVAAAADPFANCSIGPRVGEVRCQPKSAHDPAETRVRTTE